MRRGIAAILLLAWSAGCATQRVIIEDKAAAETRLFVTRSAGQVTLSWESEPDLVYSVLYNHTRSAKSPWKVLPGFERIPGTGRTITFQDRVPVSEVRFYRLQTQPRQQP